MKIINFGSLNIDKVCSVEEFVQPLWQRDTVSMPAEKD